MLEGAADRDLISVLEIAAQGHPGRDPADPHGLREVILATNPNVEGDATAHYVAERLRATGVRVTRIASGMPLGGDLEYADQVTIGRSLLHRREMGDAREVAPGLKRGA